MAQVFCHDGFAVVGAVAVDMPDGFVDIPDDFDGEDIIVIFGIPILFGAGCAAGLLAAHDRQWLHGA